MFTNSSRVIIVVVPGIIIAAFALLSLSCLNCRICFVENVIPVKIAFESVAFVKFAFVIFAPVKFAPVKSAFVKFAPFRFDHTKLKFPFFDDRDWPEKSTDKIVNVVDADAAG